MPEIKSVNAGGGVIYRLFDNRKEPEVLLIYRNELWDLPKGKQEPGESIEMCAAREVAEEVGSRMPALISELGTTYHEYSENGTDFGKTTYWFSMIFTQEELLKPQREEGIQNVKWVPLSEAIEEVGFDNLKTVLRRFMKQKKV